MSKHKFFYSDIWLVESIDSSYTLDKIAKINVSIRNINRKDKYHLQFITKSQNRNKILKLFPNAKLIQSIGLFNILKHTIFKVTTLISLLLSISTFFYLNTKIISVQVNGDSSILNPQVRRELVKNEIDVFKSKKSKTDLLRIEKQIAKTLSSSIEWIEIRQVGVTVKVKFLKRRSKIDDIPKKNGLYATKDGLIRYFRVSYGVKMVSENQYVTKDTLLVSDKVVTTKEQEIIIGAQGSVYANTWYIFDSITEVASKYNEIEVYLELLNNIHRQIDYQLDGDDEYIENESVLKFEVKDGIAVLRVHYTLLEDITR